MSSGVARVMYISGNCVDKLEDNSTSVYRVYSRAKTTVPSELCEGWISVYSSRRQCVSNR